MENNKGYKLRKVPSEMEATMKDSKTIMLKPTEESLDFGEKSFTINFQTSLGVSMSPKGISVYLNAHKVPWWAKGFLFKWWHKRLEKRLSRFDVRGERRK